MPLSKESTYTIDDIYNFADQIVNAVQKYL